MGGINVICQKFLFLRYYYVKIQFIVSFEYSIPLILCNRGCKVFKCTEDFTLTQRFINFSIYIKVLKKHLIKTLNFCTLFDNNKFLNRQNYLLQLKGGGFNLIFWENSVWR